MKNISIELGIKEVPGVAGRLDVYVKGDRVSVVVNFGALQDPRFFEGLVCGRRPGDIPHLVSRICGVCSIAHFTCSTQAVEKALGLNYGEEVLAVRRMAKGIEIIQNNLVHVLMCVSDFTDARNVVDFSKKYPKLFNRMLELNSEVLDLYRRVGGRFIHTPGVEAVYGGKPMYKAELLSISTRLEKLSHQFEDLATYLADIWNPLVPAFNDVTSTYCVLGGSSYPLFSDKLLFSDGIVVSVNDYQRYIQEEISEYSNAKYALYKGEPFYTGARARLEAYYSELSREARDAVKLLDIDFRNPFDNVKAQLAEVIHLSLTLSNMALELAERARDKISPIYSVDSTRASGEGVGAVAAPRGVLIHHYRIKDGRVAYANIITPTVMNAKHIEVNGSKLIKELLSSGSNDEDFLRKALCALLRAYDPCLLCAVH